MIAELSLLISLQETDLEIKRCTAEIENLPKRKAEIEQNFAASVKEFLDLKADYEAALAEKQQLESDIAAEQAKHEKFKADLMKATNEKQYSTAVREIDATKKSISALETELLKAMEKTEQLEAKVKERSPEIEVKRTEVDQQIAQITTAAETAQGQMSTLQATREATVTQLAPGTRSTYERVARLKSGIVLSEARDYSCTACRISIRPQAFNDIRRGERIYECENCGRILYFKSEAVAS